MINSTYIVYNLKDWLYSPNKSTLYYCNIVWRRSADIVFVDKFPYFVFSGAHGAFFVHPWRSLSFAPGALLLPPPPALPSGAPKSMLITICQDLTARQLIHNHCQRRVCCIVIAATLFITAALIIATTLSIPQHVITTIALAVTVTPVLLSSVM